MISLGPGEIVVDKVLLVSKKKQKIQSSANLSTFHRSRRPVELAMSEKKEPLNSAGSKLSTESPTMTGPEEAAAPQ